MNNSCVYEYTQNLFFFFLFSGTLGLIYLYGVLYGHYILISYYCFSLSLSLLLLFFILARALISSTIVFMCTNIVEYNKKIFVDCFLNSHNKYLIKQMLPAMIVSVTDAFIMLIFI